MESMRRAHTCGSLEPACEWLRIQNVICILLQTLCGSSMSSAALEETYVALENHRLGEIRSASRWPLMTRRASQHLRYVLSGGREYSKRGAALWCLPTGSVGTTTPSRPTSSQP